MRRQDAETNSNVTISKDSKPGSSGLAPDASDIRTRETELAELRRHEQKLQSFAGGRADGAGPTTGSRQRVTRSRRRIDWRAVLSKLPKQFTTADIRKVRGLANKPGSEIFAGITRWIEAKLVKRKDRRVYERIR